jgi:hypothetical protein
MAASCRDGWYDSDLSPVAKWRNWQTHQTQNLAYFTVRVGSTPTFATTGKLITYKFYPLPACDSVQS